MENYYRILGLSNEASADEIRRAYRVLARRYHPDVNPGKGSEDRFKQISTAYAVLSDPEKRRKYDSEYEAGTTASASTRERGFAEYARAAAQRARAEQQQTRRRRPASEPMPEPKFPFHAVIENLKKTTQEKTKKVRFFLKRRPKLRPFGARQVTDLSIIEVSVNITEAIKGIKKLVEIPSGENIRKIAVTLPPGVRSGSVVRFRQKGEGAEEIVVVVRVAAHPTLSIAQRGLVMEIPVTVREALEGARIQVPTLEEPAMISVPAGSQSGSEVRLKEKGIFYRDGTRGDIFYRLLIRVPESPAAVGLKEKSEALDPYYQDPVRKNLPRTLWEAK